MIPGNLPAQRLFIVDDEPLVVSAIRRELRHLPLEIRVHTSPLAALEDARRRVPHILVTDLIMAEMDGQELLRQMRALNPQLGVVIVSTGGDGVLWDQMDVEGVAHTMLLKPWQPKALRLAVERLGVA
jgi:CheY-like chemotaxis protein